MRRSGTIRITSKVKGMKEELKLICIICGKEIHPNDHYQEVRTNKGPRVNGLRINYGKLKGFAHNECVSAQVPDTYLPEWW